MALSRVNNFILRTKLISRISNVFVLCALIVTTTAATPKASPDIRLSFQSQYANINLKSLGISNNVWTMNGYALLARKRDSLSNFLSYTESQIRTSLYKYLQKHPALSTETSDLIVLDMEWPINPQRIGQYNGNRHFQNKIISAFKLRIKVAREIFPNAKLSLFDVAGGQKNGGTNSPGFRKMMEGFRRASEYGMFDDLDYISPSLYVRFGHRDKLYFSTLKYTKAKIEHSKRIKKSHGENIPLAPFLGFRIQNKRSEHHRECVTDKPVSKQLQALYNDSSVEIIVFWAAGVRPDNPNDQCDIQIFLHKLFQ